MKKISVYMGCILINLQFIHAQNTIGLGSDLKGVMAAGASTQGTAITSFSNGNVKGSRYLFDKWTPGNVVSFNGEVYSGDFNFNFDKINQDIYAKYNKNDVSVLIDKSKIKRFTMGSSTFVNSGTFKNAPHDIFYQAVVEDSTKVSLYSLTTTKFVKADPNDIMNARTGNTASEYIDNKTYYLSVNNSDLKKVNFTENSVKKVLKEKSDKVDSYFSMNSSKDVDEGFLIGLVTYLNQ